MPTDTEDKSAKDKPTPPTETTVTTKHKIKVNGAALAYTATCGTVVLKEDGEKDGNREADKARASIFYMAYTKDGVKNLGTRPITFCFNGGPGSSSVWLHLGVLGPRRVKLEKDGTAAAAPYELVDNEFTLLTDSDLVFIDPVGTGFSRMADGDKVSEFHNYQRDLDSVGEFIRIYTARNLRWASPKFIAGESYGTTRAAGLSAHLQEKYGMNMNGLMLISVAFDFASLRFGAGHDLPYALFLPTYAATAWYHQKLDKSLQAKSLRAFMDEVESFAANEYSQALFQGDKLDEKSHKSIAQKLARYTGLSQAYIESTKLRINIHRFCKELCRNDARTVGRLDSRFTGFDRDAAGEHAEFDPAHAKIGGAFAGCMNDYVRRELNYQADTPYKILAPLYLKWDFSSPNQALNVGESLRKAMSFDNHMKVHVGSGYYDLATPQFATEYSLNHLMLDKSLAKNIEIHYYEAGHMMYVHGPSLKAQGKHLRDFVVMATKR